ncbi:MAG: bacteriohopanetetrol glucosamine biosynthesis glycosyltransferase HpnI [Bryobacteraceae bacterium]
MIYFLYGIVAAAALYQAAALAASLIWLGWARRRPSTDTGPHPGISILKPVRGLDTGFAEAIASHARQDYPRFEILFGVGDPADPAVEAIERLQAQFPGRDIRLIHATTRAPNVKAGVLMDLAREARYPLWLVNDGDIRVPPRYLRRVAEPLRNPANGLVTCLYRAEAEGWPARLEGLGIATDFAPGVLVAPLAGVSEFGLGATLAFRAADLARAGGFAAVADYLADDFQIGRRLHALGLQCVLSDVVVTTHLSGASWREVWRHQVRWARTIRVSKGAGYAGLAITQASLWALAAALAGEWRTAAALLALRLAAGIAAGYGVLRAPDAVRLWWLIPLRDLAGVAVWAAGLLGRTVEWRGQRLRLDREGRILR